MVSTGWERVGSSWQKDGAKGSKGLLEDRKCIIQMRHYEMHDVILICLFPTKLLKRSECTCMYVWVHLLGQPTWLGIRQEPSRPTKTQRRKCEKNY